MRIWLAVILACITTPAWASLTVYGRHGVWDLFKGTDTNGEQVCGVGHTDPATGRAFSLRYVAGGSGILFVADKSSWHIPAGTHIPVVMQIGSAQPWTEQAVGNGERVEWSMDRTLVPEFDAQFRAAMSMTVRFPAGNEPPWTISLTGSAAASTAMGQCVTALMQAVPAVAPPAAPPGAAQPYGTAPAAPAIQPPAVVTPQALPPLPPLPPAPSPSQ